MRIIRDDSNMGRSSGCKPECSRRVDHLVTKDPASNVAEIKSSGLLVFGRKGLCVCLALAEVFLHFPVKERSFCAASSLSWTNSGLALTINTARTHTQTHPDCSTKSYTDTHTHALWQTHPSLSVGCWLAVDVARLLLYIHIPFHTAVNNSVGVIFLLANLKSVSSVKLEACPKHTLMVDNCFATTIYSTPPLSNSCHPDTTPRMKYVFIRAQPSCEHV